MTDLVLKRTTMIVEDAEAQARFYQEVLGWKIYYESEMAVTGKIIPIQPAGGRVKLYIMEAPDPDPLVGKVGILQWLDPELPKPAQKRTRYGIGDVVFVADAPDMDDLVKKIEAFPGAEISFPPKDGEFELPNGLVKYSSMSYWDPDGFLHEVYYRHNMPNPDQYLIRRCTNIVRDMEKSIDFYTNTLGLTLFQDSTMEIEGMLPAGKAGDTVRFVVFKCDHDYIGMVACLQYLDDPLPEPDHDTWQMGIGKVVYVGATDVPDQLFSRIAATDAKVTCEPLTRSVPASGGAGEIPMTSIGFYDLDGQLFEVNKRG